MTRGRNLVILVLDSLRYDVAVEAEMRSLDRFGGPQLRYSYASWTAPSHQAFAMGLLPHRGLRYRLAADEYNANYRMFSLRLGLDRFDISGLLPSLNLAEHLRKHHGYRTEAYVAMPVLNESTSFNIGFDHYEMTDPPNDLRSVIDRLDWSGDRPRYVFINSGLTHYPYVLPGLDAAGLPIVSGVHGVLRHDLAGDGVPYPTKEALELYRARQVETARHADACIDRLVRTSPDDTWLIVTSDHGELFGEDGYFGHGPMTHPKLFEVPFAEGPVR